jgi:predicted GNAT family N-acyltransferase
MSSTSQLKTKILPPPGPSISMLYQSNSLQTPQIFRDAMGIRVQVFCTEQGCSAANELDEDDQRSWHWVTYSSAPDRPLACIRLVPPPQPPHPNSFEDPSEKPYFKLTRLAVVPEVRGQRLARTLCEEALDWAVRNRAQIGEAWDGLVLVHAQIGVEGWWEKVGFRRDERLGRWLEEGIGHLGMWKRLYNTKETMEERKGEQEHHVRGMNSCVDG